MNRIRSALPWNKKKNYYGESDSTGYCSSSEVSRTLSASQFILRPNITFLSSPCSNSTNYYAVSTNTSTASAVSSTISKAQSLSDDHENESESTICANSVRHVPMLPKLTSLRHFMTRESQPDTTDDSADDETTLDEITTSYDDEDDEITVGIDVNEPKTGGFRSFPFSHQLVEMETLFHTLHLDEQLPSTSDDTDRTPKKRLLIMEPTRTIYYHEKVAARRMISRTESVPKSILKSNASKFAIYEEIDGDHLTPTPIDIRPKLPERVAVLPPTGFHQRHHQRSIRRHKKLPSLHHSTSFASYFRRKK